MRFHSRNTLPALILALVLPGAVATAHADAIIESVDSGLNEIRISIGKDGARIERADSSVHVLLDFDARSIHAVDTEQRYAMDMQSPASRQQEHGDFDFASVAPPALRLERMGAGPAIAGYETVHYRVLVDGRRCFDEYLAPAALDNEDIRRFIQAMAAGTHDVEQRVLIQLTEPDRLCDAVTDMIDDHYPRLGIPLRTLDARGREVHRVTRIETNAAHDAAMFRIPTGYEILTRVEVMAREAPEHDPEDLEERQRRLEQLMREHGDPASGPD
ncbi:MAG: hypothetical protein RBT81_11030 [Gammaproteobacteria bacterium]|jgi:hypothetical protein|nr:hypothetical protein [Gammaproteobacteria bacterium]